MDPFHSQALIQEADILGGIWGPGKPEDVDAEIHGYYDDVLRVGQVLPVVERSIGAADGPSCEREKGGQDMAFIKDRGKEGKSKGGKRTAAVEEYDDGF